MSAGDGYAADLVTPVRHVATELDRAAPAALPFGDLVASYRHPIPADLTRIKQHEGVKTEEEAVEFLIRQAVHALGGQVGASSDGSLRLTKPFEQLRYERKKIVRLVAQDASDDRRALMAVYADLREDRIFYVQVGTKERRYKLHPLARAIPQMSEKDFLKLAEDIKAHGGVKVPIVVYGGQVLDGRHRVALASALKVPVRVDEFKGTENEARDHVVSLNVMRRHLTMAQRGLIVRELYLPQAKAEAAKRQSQGAPTIQEQDQRTERSSALSSAILEEDQIRAKATEIAAKEANGLATARTIETMEPVDHAPKTQERIRSGEIKTAAQARREALKETRRTEPEDLPALQPRSAFRQLGDALGKVKAACEALQRADKGGEGITDEKIVGRINEIRMLLDEAEFLIKASLQ